MGPRGGSAPLPPWGRPDVPWSLSSDFSLLSGVGIAGGRSLLGGIGSGGSGLGEGGPWFGGRPGSSRGSSRFDSTRFLDMHGQHWPMMRPDERGNGGYSEHDHSRIIIGVSSSVHRQRGLRVLFRENRW